jgi:hypothetical protein
MSRKSIRIGLEELSRRNLQLNRFDPPAPPNEGVPFLGPPRNKETPSLPLLQKVGPPVPESHKNWGRLLPPLKTGRASVIFGPVPLLRLTQKRRERPFRSLA